MYSQKKKKSKQCCILGEKTEISVSLENVKNVVSYPLFTTLSHLIHQSCTNKSQVDAAVWEWTMTNPLSGSCTKSANCLLEQVIMVSIHGKQSLLFTWDEHQHVLVILPQDHVNSLPHNLVTGPFEHSRDPYSRPLYWWHHVIKSDKQ